MRKLMASFMAVFAFCGCANQKPLAYVNDVSVRHELDAGYTLVAVDGEPVEREAGKVATAAPFALVEPGVHTLTLKPKNGWEAKESQDEITINVTLEAGKHYRFASQQGEVTIVEDFEH